MQEKKRPADMEQYVLDHLDEALANNYIKVYVQPVVRALTRQVCGMEALARWQDPEYGLLQPAEFIGVLEKNRRIHELDIYMIHKVCEHYSLSGEHIEVPVSINLSRLDYELCDIFAEVDATVRTHKISRDNLCIEITESAVTKNENLMRHYIERFRSAGYPVWMDDFGSGYSSFNVLKDFQFDELKIDMRFLSDFRVRSQRILASIVRMAKEIQMQTLAEGVETEEEFKFLRNIGCEKVQGYLFGEPMPFEECLQRVAEAGMTWESPKLRRYYDEIGRLNVLSATPFAHDTERETSITGLELNSIAIAVVELRGKAAEMLFANDAFAKTASAIDWPLKWDYQAGMACIFLRKFSLRMQKLLEEARSGGEGRLLSVYDNEYYELHATRLARSGDACAILMNVSNLSRMSDMVRQEQLDEGLRSLYSVYEQVMLINLNDLTVMALHLDRDMGQKMKTGSLTARIDEYAEKRLYPDDRERFRRFLCPASLEERTVRDGGINIHLRTLSLHGSYDWKCYQLVRIRKNIFYLLIRNAESEVHEFQSVCCVCNTGDGTMTPELLWENAVNHAGMKFFWKDRERRFVGASKSFLEYFAFKSLDDIAGKTDEDMGWHIHNDPYRDEEWKVLREGITSRSVKGNCIAQGENHEIVATKMPVFSRDGKIIGLLGAFSPMDGRESDTRQVKQIRTDGLTGLLNSRGLYEDFYAYTDEYELRGRDFACIEISIDGFYEINSLYGYDFGDAVIRKTGRAILRCCGNAAAVGRVSGSTFTVFRQFTDKTELEALVARIRQIPGKLRRIGNTPFSLYLSVGMALYSETGKRDAMLAQAKIRRLTDDVENISQRQLMENTRHVFHMFENLPMSYAVFKLVDGPEGGDAIVLYANKMLMKVMHLKEEMLIGKKVSGFFDLKSNTWLSMAKEAALQGKSVQGVFHLDSVYLSDTVRCAVYPVIGPGFCAFAFKKAGSDNTVGTEARRKAK